MNTVTTTLTRALAVALLPGLAACSGASNDVTADLILTNGYVYTVDSTRSVAEAVAIQGNRIVAVGTSGDVLALAGADTDIRDLDGKLVLPGLHDMHIHVTDTVASEFCGLDNEAHTLDEIVELGRECVEERKLAADEWLPIIDWEPYAGNQPSDAHPTMLAALDAVSEDVRVVLWSADGHSAAANTAAFNALDTPINAETLATTYAHIASYVPLNADGTLTGRINEEARHMLRNVDRDFIDDPMPPSEKMPKVAAGLARNGITSIQHPSVHPSAFEDLVWLAREGDMTFRLRMAFRVRPGDAGESDWIEHEIARVSALRESISDQEQIQANAVKIFADDVLEGNPFASPPSKPNSAMLDGFHNPIFEIDDEGNADVVGYHEVTDEHRAHGRVTYSSEDLVALVDAATDAGFHTHIHAIGDHAARNAADGFENSVDKARASGLTQSVAHLQIIKTDDIVRLGSLGVYATFTYLWATPEPEYEMLVVPFIDKIDGIGDLYNPDHYYVQNAYPVRSFVDAGGIAVFGSDAPVGNRSSRPFRNMKAAMTREADGLVLNASQVLDIHETLAAFTIHGARLMGHDDELGSIEVGKLADIAVVDRNLVELADRQEFASIRDAEVTMTIFDGRVIYETEKP